jgi:hypothetical protein
MPVPNVAVAPRATLRVRRRGSLLGTLEYRPGLRSGKGPQRRHTFGTLVYGKTSQIAVCRLTTSQSVFS